MASPRVYWAVREVTVPHGRSLEAPVAVALNALSADGWEPVHVTAPVWRESSPTAVVLITAKRVAK